MSVFLGPYYRKFLQYVMIGFCICVFISTRDSLIYFREQEHLAKDMKEQHKHVWTTVSKAAGTEKRKATPKRCIRSYIPIIKNKI